LQRASLDIACGELFAITALGGDILAHTGPLADFFRAPADIFERAKAGHFTVLVYIHTFRVQHCNEEMRLRMLAAFAMLFGLAATPSGGFTWPLLFALRTEGALGGVALKLARCGRPASDLDEWASFLAAGFGVAEAKKSIFAAKNAISCETWVPVAFKVAFISTLTAQVTHSPHFLINNVRMQSHSDLFQDKYCLTQLEYLLPLSQMDMF
jgi:hypothetical protein